MANPERGELSVDIGGVPYTLKASINGCIEAEALLSREEGRKVFWTEIVEQSNAGSMRHRRAIFWSTLRSFHRDVTLEQAGELSDILDAQSGISVLKDALDLSAPDERDVKEITPKGRPRRAQTSLRLQDGTGAASSSGHAKSA